MAGYTDLKLKKKCGERERGECEGYSVDGPVISLKVNFQW